jgi:GTP-binding protein
MAYKYIYYNFNTIFIFERVITIIIRKAEYIISAVDPKGYPNHDLVEFAFFGRSNVGKSSVINAIAKRKNLARTSQTPGKTITINFFNINDEFSIVDVPGYGYAKRSDAQIQQFGEMIEKYLNSRENLKVAFLLVDLRHKPTENDVLMANYLKSFPCELKVIATKADKIGKTLIARHVKQLIMTLGVRREDVIVTSSVTNLGIEEIYKVIENHK